MDKVQHIGGRRRTILMTKESLEAKLARDFPQSVLSTRHNGELVIETGYKIEMVEALVPIEEY